MTVMNAGSVVFGRAAEILDTRIVKNRCYGFAAINGAFGLNLPIEEEPPLTFSESELVRAKELGQVAILFIAEAEGTPLTKQWMCKRLGNKLGNGRLLYDTACYQREAFFKTETPRFGWRLVTPEVIPGSLGVNHLEQTKLLVDYLTNQVFANEKVPAAYIEALEKWSAKKSRISSPLSSDWRKAAPELASLKINQLLRLNPAEELFLNIVNFKANGGERFLEATYSWTATLSSDGGLVGLGGCASVGMRVDGVSPGRSHSDLGVRFSRSSQNVVS